MGVVGNGIGWEWEWLETVLTVHMSHFHHELQISIADGYIDIYVSV